MKKEEMRRGTDTQMIIVILLNLHNKKLVHLMNELEKNKIKKFLVIFSS